MNARTRLGALAIAVAVSVAVAACSSSSSSSQPTGASTAGSTAQAASSGSPIVIGFTTIVNDLGANYAPQEQVATDVAAHLNAAGGIGGHPIKLVTCNQLFASGGAQCADQFLQDKAVLVMGFSITDDGPMYPILKSAGVPFLGAGGPSTAAGLTPDGNHWYTTSGPLGLFLAVDNFLATQLHPKKVGVIVGSTTSAQQAADTFVKAPLNKAGIDVTLVPISESNPDFTSALNSLRDSDFVFTLTTCAQTDAVFQQAAAIGLKLSGLVNQCSSAADIKALGAGAAGKYGFDVTVPVDDPRYANRPDVKAYLALAKQYGWEHSEYNGEAYQLLMAAVSLIKQAGGAKATAAQIKTAIASSNGALLPLGPPQGLTCSKPPFKVIPTACSVNGLMVVIQGSGQVRAYNGDWISP